MSLFPWKSLHLTLLPLHLHQLTIQMVLNSELQEKHLYSSEVNNTLTTAICCRCAPEYLQKAWTASGQKGRLPGTLWWSYSAPGGTASLLQFQFWQGHSSLARQKNWVRLHREKSNLYHHPDQTCPSKPGKHKSGIYSYFPFAKLFQSIAIKTLLGSKNCILHTQIYIRKFRGKSDEMMLSWIK